MSNRPTDDSHDTYEGYAQRQDDHGRETIKVGAGFVEVANYIAKLEVELVGAKEQLRLANIDQFNAEVREAELRAVIAGVRGIVDRWTGEGTEPAPSDFYSALTPDSAEGVNAYDRTLGSIPDLPEGFPRDSAEGDEPGGISLTRVQAKALLTAAERGCLGRPTTKEAIRELRRSLDSAEPASEDDQ